MMQNTMPRSVHPPMHWIVSAAFVASVIAGLLGMHTFAKMHHEAPPMTMTLASVESAHASTADHEPATAPSCGDCTTSGSHDAVMLACVLALLAAVALAARTVPGIHRTRAADVRAVATGPPRAVMPRPLSLDELSISRT